MRAARRHGGFVVLVLLGAGCGRASEPAPAPAVGSAATVAPTPAPPAPTPAPAAGAGAGPRGDGEGEGGGGGDGGGRKDPGAYTIAIVDGKRTTSFTRAQLEALPTQAPPMGDNTSPGWSLADVLRAARVARGATVLLTDAAGATLKVTAAELAPDRGLGFLKLNREGLLRFKLLAREDGSAGRWRPRGDLRGLVSIQRIK